MPADRLHHVLRGLLDSPEKFLRFLRALLGGARPVDRGGQRMREKEMAPAPGASASAARPCSTISSAPRPETLIASSRSAALIDDLRKTEEGRRIVPDELLAVWTAVEEALTREPRS